MRKSMIAVILGIACFLAVPALANDVNLGVQVTMPIATAIKAEMAEINSNGTATPDDDVWGTVSDVTSGATLNFDTRTMTKNATTGVYSTGYYYVLEITPDGGGWGGPVSVRFTSGTPNDIGQHATLTLVKATYTSATTPPTESQIVKSGLINFTATQTVSASTLSGSWLRAYVGLATGEEPATYNVTPFTDSTPGGLYSGSLQFSYTGS
jgi:hypothetical protein